MLPILHLKSSGVRLWGINVGVARLPYFFFFLLKLQMWQTVVGLHSPRPRLLGSPHQHCQTRGSLSRSSNSHYECYARYEWMVSEPMGASPTLQQQPRNRPFGGVTCSQSNTAEEPADRNVIFLNLVNEKILEARSSSSTSFQPTQTNNADIVIGVHKSLRCNVI